MFKTWKHIKYHLILVNVADDCRLTSKQIETITDFLSLYIDKMNNAKTELEYLTYFERMQATSQIMNVLGLEDKVVEIELCEDCEQINCICTL